MNEPTIFKIHIRPENKEPTKCFEYCLANKILGVGWQAKGCASDCNWEEYEKRSKHHKKINIPRYIYNNVKPDDLVWTRDGVGRYYLAKVLSGWEYLTNEEAVAVDITNIFRCDIKPVSVEEDESSVDQIPGKVITSFRSTMTINRILAQNILWFSKLLWNKLSGTSYYSTDFDHNDKDIFDFLDTEAVEDIVAIYLQSKGWWLIPNSRKADTMSYEYYLIHNETKERAIVQVKTGTTKLNLNSYQCYRDKVFLFQARSLYENKNGNDNIICIEPEEVRNFIKNNLNLMPKHIAFWWNYLKTTA